MMKSRLPLLLIAALAAPTSVAVAQPIAGQAGVDSDGDGIDDDVDADPCDPDVSLVMSVPSNQNWGMFLFEDKWPSRGDFDFNDAVVAYQETIRINSANQVTGLEVNLQVMAVGASYANGLALRLPSTATTSVGRISLKVSGAGRPVTLRSSGFLDESVIVLADDLHALFGAEDTREWINTDPSLPARAYVTLTLDVEILPGAGLSTADAPFDLFIFNVVRGTEVHRPEFQGTSALNGGLFGTLDDGSTAQRSFVTKAGIPFALALPEPVLYAKEGTAIDALYPSIVQFGASGGQQSANFYRSASPGVAFGNLPVLQPLPAVVPLTSCFAPLNGVCGAAAGNPAVDAPISGLCGLGAASSVASNNGYWQWTCTGNYSVGTLCEARDLVCAQNVSESCAINNGTGSRQCNGSGTGFSTCQTATCNPGFYLDVNACTAQVCTPNSTRSCTASIPNSSAATEACNNLGSRYHACALSTCQTGYQVNGSTCVGQTTNGFKGGTWHVQQGTSGQETYCGSVSSDGLSCYNPLVRYDSHVGTPRQHSSNNVDAWCQQLGFDSSASVAYASSQCTGGALFMSASYDTSRSSLLKWADWADGAMLDGIDSQCYAGATYASELRCVGPVTVTPPTTGGGTGGTGGTGSAGQFTAGAWHVQSGTNGQDTYCATVSNGGTTCHNPLVRYDGHTGTPRQHSSNNIDTWCQQLGFSNHTSVTYATNLCIGGALFMSASYDTGRSSLLKWADWADGAMLDGIDSQCYTGATYVSQVTCN